MPDLLGLSPLLRGAGVAAASLIANPRYLPPPTPHRAPVPTRRPNSESLCALEAGELTPFELGELDQVAAGVVQPGDARARRLRDRHGELHPQLGQAIVLGLDACRVT